MYHGEVPLQGMEHFSETYGVEQNVSLDQWQVCWWLHKAGLMGECHSLNAFTILDRNRWQREKQLSEGPDLFCLWNNIPR